jgi:hypothetical protein
VALNFYDTVPADTSIAEETQFLISLVGTETNKSDYATHEKVDMNKIRLTIACKKKTLQLIGIICFKSANHYYVVAPDNKPNSFVEINDFPPTKKILQVNQVRPVAYFYKIN